MARHSSDIDVLVGQCIQRRRVLLALTEGDLATTLGVVIEQLRQFETGYARVTVHDLFALSRALDVPISYFYTWAANDLGEAVRH